MLIRNAEDYAEPDFSRDPRAMEPAGIEPATS